MQTSKERIALVVHRYGKEICGGAELLCQQYAQQLKRYYDVEVLTTTALSDVTWSNHYPATVERVDDVLVRRFFVEIQRDPNADFLLHELLKSGNSNKVQEWTILMKTGPYVPSLVAYIRRKYQQYKAIIFFTYYYYPFSVGSLGIPNAILLPTAHDEPMIKLQHYKELLSSAGAFIFNTVSEKKVVEEILGHEISVPNVVCGSGISVKPVSTDVPGLPDRYIVYAGRISESKNCGELFEYFLKFRSENPKSDLKLVLVGAAQMTIPQDPSIVYLGFVEEGEKDAIIAGAKALVQPSHYESLSFTCLEALASGVPILVSDSCPVLREHVSRSGVGHAYKNYYDFTGYLTELCTTQPNEELKLKAKKYIEEYYQWDSIMNKVKSLIQTLNYCPQVDDGSSAMLTESNESGDGVYFMLSADNNYVSFLSVVLQSIVQHSNANNTYNCTILSDGISDLNKELISGQYNKGNFRISFYECNSLFSQLDLKINNSQLSRSTFSRLFLLSIPEFTNIKKVVYLDCDVLVRTDIADLFRVELQNAYVAAIPDPHIEVIRKINEKIKRHLQEDVGVGNRNYFNAGVLVFNLEELRKNWTTEKLLSIAQSRMWQWEDQDVLNRIATGKVKWLDYSWNLIWVGDRVLQEMMESNNLNYSKAFHNPKIVHYAGGQLPTNVDNTFFSEEYWQVARRTPYYESMLVKYLKHQNLFSCVQAQPELPVKQGVWAKVRNYYQAYGAKATIKKIFQKLGQYLKK